MRSEPGAPPRDAAGSGAGGPDHAAARADASARLAEVCASVLEAPAPAWAARAAEAVRDRHEGVSAVLLYGSCLRRRSAEGVIDLLVVVDRYRDAYARRWLAAANALLPPNVFHLETPAGRTPREDGPLRIKYSVLSARHFERGAAFRTLQSFVWVRACQPMRLVYARDAAARELARRAAARAALELVDRMVPRLPERDGRTRVAPGELFGEAFRQTYRSEWRAESPESVRGLYTADRAHYDRLAPAALRRLEELGRLRVLGETASAVEVALPAGRRRAARLSWALRRPVAKTAAALRLLKTAATFSDWVPYALWKLERHSGERIEASERQRRSVWVWGWPVLFRVLRRRHLR